MTKWEVNITNNSHMKSMKDGSFRCRNCN